MMKKIQLDKLENINGGTIKCGWVGVGTAVSISFLSSTNILTGALGLYTLAGDVVRCWNS